MRIFTLNISIYFIQGAARIIIVLLLLIVQPGLKYSWAHLSESNIREWEDRDLNLRILFSYVPEEPIIDTFTELKFSVVDLETGEHIKDFEARVVVTLPSGERLFRFENITVADGDFSVKYIFPDDGMHQVILRLDFRQFIVLASFDVFIPHTPLPSLNPFSELIEEGRLGFAGISFIVIVIAIIAVIITVKTKLKNY